MRFWKLLFDQRGEVAMAAPATAAPAGGGTNGTTEAWYSSLAPELANHDAIKQIPDVPTLAKSYLDSQSEIGRRVRFPDKTAKPEERQAFTKKLAEGGYLPVVPESADKYEIAKTEGQPWNENWEKMARDTFHKLGFTQEQTAGAVELHKAMVGEQVKAQEAETAKNLEALKAAWGADYAANAELVARAGFHIFGSAEEAARHTGNSDPKWLDAMLKVGKMLEGDNGFAPAGSNAPANANAAQEMQDILRNAQNPKYKLFWAGDKSTVDYVNGLRESAWPGETQIS